MTTDSNACSPDDMALALGLTHNWREAYEDSSIVARLKRTRQALGLSMTAVALKAGVNVQRINDFEKGTRRPSVEQLYRWSEALEMDTPAILMAFMVETLQRANLDTYILTQRYSIERFPL